MSKDPSLKFTQQAGRCNLPAEWMQAEEDETRRERATEELARFMRPRTDRQGQS